MREPRLRSSPSFFHPSTNRRMYRFASNGEMGEPCGMPRRLSRASVVRVFLPRLSVSSTGQSSHILIRCSTRRSTIRRVTDFRSSLSRATPSAVSEHSKAEAGYRFYALYDKISREDILAHAFGVDRFPNLQ